METKPTNESEYPEYTQYYAAKKLEGDEYQDFVSTELHKRGIVVQNMVSQKYGGHLCENLLGLEIKYDQQIHNYKLFNPGMGEQCHHLYIETDEKSHPKNPRYVRSGIYRVDNCWLFGIGDHNVLWIFGKKALRRLDSSDPKWLMRKEKPTSRGFLIPLKKANNLAELVINFGDEQ